jgi:hypothetical protein
MADLAWATVRASFEGRVFNGVSGSLTSARGQIALGPVVTLFEG